MRHVLHFDMSLVNFVYNGTESISFSEPKIWDTIPNETKEMEAVEKIKGAV